MAPNSYTRRKEETRYGLVGGLGCVVLAVGCGRSPGASAQTSAVSAAPIEHTYRTADGIALKPFVFSSAGTTGGARTPAILLFHGGGWVAGALDWTFTSARRYAELGMVSISVEYRLSTDSVTPIDALADVCSALRWIRAEASALGIDPRRVAASGVSAGATSRLRRRPRSLWLR